MSCPPRPTPMRWAALAVALAPLFGSGLAAASPPGMPAAPPAPPPVRVPVVPDPAPRTSESAELPAEVAEESPEEIAPSPAAPVRAPAGGSTPVPIRYEPIVVPTPVFPAGPALPVDLAPLDSVSDVAPLIDAPSETVAAPEEEAGPDRAPIDPVARVRRAFFEAGPDAAFVIADQIALAAGRPLEQQAVEARVLEAAAHERDPARFAAVLANLSPRSRWVAPVSRLHLERACRGNRHADCLDAARAYLAIEGIEEEDLPRGQVILGSRIIPLDALARVRPRTVGVLLPLSGPYAHIGEAAERALRLAFEGVEGVELLIRDTRGEADLAENLTEALIFKDRVAAIIGPIGRHEVARSAAVSRAWGMPQVVLSSALDPAPGFGDAPEDVDSPAELTPLEDTAVRVRTSPEELARAVARHAVVEQGLTRLAIFRPNTEAGARLSEAFRDEVSRLGVSLVTEAGYDPDAKDFKPFVNSLLEGSRARTSARARRDARLVMDFDGLFIPDAAARVRRIVPFIEFGGATFRTRPGGPGVQLLGGPGWNHSSVIDRATGLTDNAVFADTWADIGDDDRATAFSRRFFAAHAQRAGAFHAEVFDAGALLAEAVLGATGEDHRLRGEVLRRLLSGPPRAGVTGVIAFRGAVAMPRAHLMTVDGETLRGRVSEEEEAFLRGRVQIEGQ